MLASLRAPKLCNTARGRSSGQRIGQRGTCTPRHVVRYVDPRKEEPPSSLLHDGVRMIYNDHKHFRGLFSRYEHSDSKAEKLNVVRQLVTELSAHSSAEQRYVYPLIVSKLDQEDLQDRNYLDEKVNQIVLDWVDSHTPLTDQQWEVFDSTMHKLKMQLQDHMTEEEKFVLQPLNQALSAEEKEKLYKDLAWAKEHAPTHPHPEGPMRPVASKVLHPVVSEIDKALDRVFSDETDPTSPGSGTSGGSSHSGSGHSGSGGSGSGRNAGGGGGFGSGGGAGSGGAKL